MAICSRSKSERPQKTNNLLLAAEREARRLVNALCTDKMTTRLWGRLWGSTKHVPMTEMAALTAGRLVDPAQASQRGQRKALPSLMPRLGKTGAAWSRLINEIMIR
jgi:hypothetical protein